MNSHKHLYRKGIALLLCGAFAATLIGPLPALAAPEYITPPNRVTADVERGNSVRLEWNDRSDNESGFEIERKERDDFILIDTVGRNRTTYTDKDLKWDTRYIYRIIPLGDSDRNTRPEGTSEEVTVWTDRDRDHSAYSNEISTRSRGDYRLSAPRNLTGKAVSTSRIKLEWTDDSTGESGFQIERRTGNGSYSDLARTDANVTSFTDAGLFDNTSYTYRIRAIGRGSYSDSPTSNEITVQTTMGMTVPKGLAGTTLSPTDIKLTWWDDIQDESGFQLERKTGNSGYIVVTKTTANATNYTDSGLTPDTMYTYRLKALGTSSNPDSLYSSEVNVRTAQGQAQAPKTVLKFTVGATTYTENGQSRTMDAGPAVIDGRTFLPIRYVAAHLNAVVGWLPDEQKSVVTLQGKTIELWIGRSDARIGTTTLPIDAANANIKPYIAPPGRTMLPLRFISENLGCQVDWDSGTNVITVTYPK